MKPEPGFRMLLFQKINDDAKAERKRLMNAVERETVINPIFACYTQARKIFQRKLN
jgi:hypothetical protein